MSIACARKNFITSYSLSYVSDQIIIERQSQQLLTFLASWSFDISLISFDRFHSTTSLQYFQTSASKWLRCTLSFFGQEVHQSPSFSINIKVCTNDLAFSITIAWFDRDFSWTCFRRLKKFHKQFVSRWMFASMTASSSSCSKFESESFRAKAMIDERRFLILERRVDFDIVPSL